MKRYFLIWISALALLSSLAMASSPEEKNAEVAPGIYFSKLPVITDMNCNETQLLEYTVTNNISVTVRVNQSIQVLAGNDGVADVTISGGTCGVLPSFNLDAGDSCTIDVSVIAQPCNNNSFKGAKKPLSLGSQVRQALVLVPSTTVQRNPLTSIIQLNVIQKSTVITGLRAYIANDDDSNIVTMCPVNSDGTLGNSDNTPECTPLSDDTFNVPVDVIVSPKGAFTGGVTMAYVANSNNNSISECPVNLDGKFGLCKSPAFTDLGLEFSAAGLRLSSDNTKLYVTNTIFNTVTAVPVLPDGTLSSPTENYHGDFANPSGRIVENLTYSYTANHGNNSVSICSSIFINCQYETDLNNFNLPLGLDIDVTDSYLFVANTNNRVASCPITGGTLGSCHYSDGDTTFDFTGAVTNLYMQNYNGYGYIPNDGNNTVSICPVSSSTGEIGTQISPDLPCTTADGSDLGFTQPASVWIADLSPQLLYVGNNNSTVSGSPSIEVFSLPLTSLSTPITTVTGLGSAVGFAFDDSGNLFVADDQEGTVDTFTLPLTNTSVPSATFSPASSPAGVTFDDIGRLFVSMENGNIAVYDPPGTLSFTLLGAEEPYQMAFDSDGNLNVADCKGYIQVYQPPFSGNQTPDVTVSTPGNICAGGAMVTMRNAMEVLAVTTYSNEIYIYQLPLPSGAPTMITGPASVVWGYNIAADSSFNTYVPDYSGYNMDVFGVFSTSVSTSLPLGFLPGGVAVH